jgi:hypothetical protein
MAYVPVNLDFYLATFSGALGGMAASGKIPTSSNPAKSTIIVAAAGAFAQQLDTETGSGQSGIIALAQMYSFGIWEGRTSFSVTPTDYDAECQGFIGVLTSVSLYLAAQGIPINGLGSSVVKQVQTATGLTPSFPQLTVGGTEAADALTIPILTTLGNKLTIVGSISANGSVHVGTVDAQILVDGINVGQAHVAFDTTAVGVAISVSGEIDATGGNQNVVLHIILGGAAGTKLDNSEPAVMTVIESKNP